MGGNTMLTETKRVTKITKRDGRTVPFDEEKIAKAIYAAAQAIGGHDEDIARELAHEVTVYLEEKEMYVPSVEQVQDAVEKVLIENGHARTAKGYILYRAERTKIRNMNTKLMKTMEDLTFKPAEDNDIKRENANINGDTAMGVMLKYGSESAKQFYEMFILDPKHSEAHNSGDIHIHDLDFLTLTTTCCQIDIEKLFDGGFCTGHGFLREPQYIASYAALACIAIQSNQNDQHGGQSIPNFDYGLAKGVAKSYRRNYRLNLAKALELVAELEDGEAAARQVIAELQKETGLEPKLARDNDYAAAELEKLLGLLGGGSEKIVGKVQRFTVKSAEKETDRDTYKAMVALIHNLNTMHSRAGAQIPFSSLNYGTDTSAEGRMVVKNILLSTEAGLGNGETPIFPIQIFKVKEGINYNSTDPNYDLFKLACRVSAKRLFPNFSFLDAPFNLQYYQEGRPETEVAYMGCRTRVMANVDKDKETTYGRGNLSFTSVNLPRLAIKSGGDLEIFFDDLDRKIDLIIEQLLARFKIQYTKTIRNYPFLMGQGVWLDSDQLQEEDDLRQVLRHGTLTLGFIGLAECLKFLLGKHHGESKEAQNLGLEIVGYMRQKMDQATEKYDLNFSLIATPAEGLSGRFVRIDKKKYGVIPGVTDREYYTNGFHIPVYYDINAFDKIKLEAPYHTLTNGGHISYVELDGDPCGNLEAFEQIVRCMKECGVGYGSINHPVDRDPVCGYTGIIGNTCPKCGRSEDDGRGIFERIRRITGYLVGTLDLFNNAKRAEERDRVKHFDVERPVEIKIEEI